MATMGAVGETPDGAAAGVMNGAMSAPYRRYALFMMTAVATLNFVDRQLLSMLLEPIKAEFALTDTQLGFLTGFAFAIFYTLVGFPLAKLADQGNRRNLVSAVIAIWSIMTALCGAAVGFWTLLAARIGVGAGEAGSGPAIQSMLADHYPPSERSSAIGIQSTGVYLGILIGNSVNGGVYGTMFPQREVDILAQPNRYYNPDIQGLTAIDHVFGRACDWVSAGSKAAVFPQFTSKPIETGLNLTGLFA